MSFSDAQRKVLLEPIKPYRVSKDGKGFSHLEAYEVIAHLNRLFGFEGWDKEVRALELIFEEEVNGKWTVGYRCTLALTVRALDEGFYQQTMKEDASIGDARNQPSRADAHDLAMKSAISGALKRCAKDLGDQMGLSLYNKGSTDPLVKRVIPYESTFASTFDPDKPSAEDYLA